LAEAAVQLRARRSAEPQAPFRTAAYVASIFASNAPDLDFLYARITERPLGYLMHHRGHTHTVPALLAIGLLTITTLRVIERRKKFDWSPSDRVVLATLAFVAAFAHVAMDFTNNYGVHPFWPVYDGWFYGDAVFIVEPFFWAVAIPPLVFAVKTRTVRFSLALVLVFGVVLSWLIAFAPEGRRIVPPLAAAAFTLTAIAATLTARRLTPPARVAFGIVSSWSVAAVFGIATSAAASAVRHSPLLDRTTVHDVVLTPMPANPLCASVLVVGTEGEDYVIKRATVAPLPALVSSDACPTAPDGDPTAPLIPIAVATPDVIWKDEFRAPLAELLDLERDNCQAQALFRFARAPYWKKTGPDQLIIGDLRYDRQPGLDFSDLRIEARPLTCPRAVPPWLPPRRDLLESANGSL
jgi:inner membrane protein